MKYCVKNDPNARVKLRFASPLYYIPCLNEKKKFKEVYILVNKGAVNELVKDGLQAEFTLSKIDKKKSCMKLKSKCIDFPEQFNLEDFMDSYCNASKAGYKEDKLIFRSEKANYECKKVTEKEVYA